MATPVSLGDLTPDMIKQITETKKQVDESYKKREKNKLDFHKKAFKVHRASLQAVLNKASSFLIDEHKFLKQKIANQAEDHEKKVKKAEGMMEHLNKLKLAERPYNRK